MDYITKNKVQISYMDFRGLCVRWAYYSTLFGSRFKTLQQNQIYQPKRTRKAPDQAGAHFHLSEYEEISENHEKQGEGFLALWAIFS